MNIKYVMYKYKPTICNNMFLLVPQSLTLRYHPHKQNKTHDRIPSSSTMRACPWREFLQWFREEILERGIHRKTGRGLDITPSSDAYGEHKVHSQSLRLWIVHLQMSPSLLPTPAELQVGHTQSPLDPLVFRSMWNQPHF